MTETSKSEAEDRNSKDRWPLLGLAGVLSLCCLVTSSAATGGAGATLAGGTMAAFGGDLTRILVSAVTAGAVGVAIQLWPSHRCSG